MIRTSCSAAIAQRLSINDGSRGSAPGATGLALATFTL
jgi:hypothetical protein